MYETKMKANTVIIHIPIGYHLEKSGHPDNKNISELIQEGYEMLEMNISYRPDERLVDGYEPMLTLLLCKKEVVCAGSNDWSEEKQRWVCDMCGETHT